MIRLARVPSSAADTGQSGAATTRIPNEPENYRRINALRFREFGRTVEEGCADAGGRAEFWGRARDGRGGAAEATVITPDGYSLTVETSLEIMARVLAGEVEAGFSTPARAFGAGFIERFGGVEFQWRSGPA